MRFDQKTKSFKEITLVPPAIADIEGIPLTWDLKFFREMCIRDGNPQEDVGYILLLKLGLALTGFHDRDKSQLAVTAFRKEDLEFERDFQPFDMASVDDH